MTTHSPAGVAPALPRVFIGSSREALPLARGLKATLEEWAEVRVWDEDLFEPGRYALEDLLRFTRTFDVGVFVLADDDLVTSRGVSQASPRDNVVFEAGIFFGALGRERVFLFVPASATKMPSDLFGLTTLPYRKPSDGNFRAATSSGCQRLRELLARLGPVSREPAPPSTTEAEPARVYRALDDARAAVRSALYQAQDVKILSNKGLVFFGLDESLLSLAELDRLHALRRLRVILLDPESRWVDRGLMALRRYESLDDFRKELQASHQIVESAMRKTAVRLGLHNSGVKYNLGEPYFRALLTEHVAFVSSYAEHPSVQVRELPVHEFRPGHGSLYGALKRHFNDLWHNASRPGPYLQATLEPEVSAGGVVLARRAGRTYVALVMREDGSWVLPKGHKERGEDLLAAARREIFEETGLPPELLVLERQLDEFSHDETARRLDVTKVNCFFLMRLASDVLPELRPDPDHGAARWFALDEPWPYLFYAYQRTLLAEVAERELGQRPTDAG